ncbi:MAG: hypothetical protein K1X51_12660 [Rhodospirillaceae bacterium]|nr:hypothetical protein [Rhodospirillaceae bacterium]
MQGDLLSRPDVVEQIRQALDYPQLDIATAVASGELVAAATPPPGFTTLVQLSPDTIVAIARSLRYRHFYYREDVAAIDAYERRGGRSFPEILAILRANTYANAFSDAKIAGSYLGKAYGYDMLARAYMGQVIAMRRDMTAHFHHFFVQHILRESLTRDIDCVFDLGSGKGDILAELAASAGRPDVQFIGGELAEHGRACLDRFAGMLGMRNLRSAPFDMRAPDFSVLAGFKNVLLISHYALVYLNPFRESFWRAAFATTPAVRATLLEPVSFSVPELTNRPLFKLRQARDFGQAENFIEVLRNLQGSGELRITEIVPDISGLSALSSLSLVRFEKTPP